MPEIIKGADLIQSRYQEQDIADQYEDSRFSTLLGRLIHVQEMNAVNEALSFHPLRLLEVATGPGRISKDIRLGAKTTAIGLDSSAPMVRLAQRNVQNKKWSFVCGDARSLPFPDQAFDALVSFHFIRHLTAPERARVLREFYRVLKEDGVLIMDALNAERGLLARSLDSVYHLTEQVITRDKGVYDVRYRKSELQQELAGVGFHIQSMCGVARLYSLHFIFNLPFEVARYIKQKCLRKDVGAFYRWVRDKFLSVALLIERSQNRDKGYLWVVTCQKKPRQV